MVEDPGGWVIDEYVTAGGRNLVLGFLSKLAGRDRVEAVALLKLLKERGNTLKMPHSESLGEGLFELRGDQVRIFYMFRPGRRITLLDGMVKKRGSIPHRMLARVRAFKKEVEVMDRKDLCGG